MISQKLHFNLLVASISICALLTPGSIFSSLLVTPESLKAAWGVVSISTLFFLWLLIKDKNSQITIVKTRFYYPIIGFLSWSAISLTWVVDSYLASIQLIQFISVALIFFIILNSIRSDNEVKRLFFFIIIASTVVSIFGLLQLILPNNGIIQGFATNNYTPSASTFGNKNMASHFIIMTLPLIVAFILMARSIKQTALFTLVFLICASYLISTYARASLMALFVQFIVVFIFLVFDRLKNKKNPFITKKSKTASVLLFFLLVIAALASSFSAFYQEGIFRIIFIVLAFSVITILFFLSIKKSASKLFMYRKIIFFYVVITVLLGVISYVSINNNPIFSKIRYTVQVTKDRLIRIPVEIRQLNNPRVSVWKNTVELIKDNPVLGVGVGQWPAIYPLYYDRASKDLLFNEKVRMRHAHNDYLEFLSNFGFVGIIFLLWLFILTIKVSYSLIMDLNYKNRYLVLGSVLGLTGFSIVAFFSFPLKVYYPLLLVMVYISVIANMYFRNKKSESYNKNIKNINKNSVGQIVSVCNKKYFIFNKAVKNILLLFSVSIAVLVGITSYKWIMGEHYFNYTQSVDLAEYDDPTRKIQDKLKLIEQSITYNPFPSEALYLAGMVNLEAGFLKKGITYLKRSLEASPYRSHTLLSLSLAYKATGDSSNQLRAVEKYMEIDPKSVRAHVQATTLYAKLGRTRDAKDAYRKMKDNYSYFKNRDGFGPYFVGVGKTAQAMGDISYAKEVFLEAVDKYPKNALYYEYLGGMYLYFPEKKSEKAKGIAFFKQALELDPEVLNHEALKKEILHYSEEEVLGGFLD